MSTHKKPFLLIIDLQEKLIGSITPVAIETPVSIKKQTNILKNASILIKSWTLLGLPLGYTEQYPKGLGPTLPELKELLRANAYFHEKTQFSAVCDDLLTHLNREDITDVYIGGIETHICVFQTVRDLIDHSMDVHLITDVLSSRNQHNHDMAIDKMVMLGAQITSTELLIFELLKDAKHPRFKEISQLIK